MEVRKLHTRSVRTMRVQLSDRAPLHFRTVEASLSIFISCLTSLVVAGLTHIITMDLHQKEIQGFFSFPVDNLRASPFLIQYIQEEVRL